MPAPMIYDEVTDKRYPEDEYFQVVEARSKRQAILGGITDTHNLNLAEKEMGMR
jgi:hypothetical protein